MHPLDKAVNNMNFCIDEFYYCIKQYRLIHALEWFEYWTVNIKKLEFQMFACP